MGVDKRQIVDLMAEAAQAGDRLQVALCIVALELGALGATLEGLDPWQQVIIEEQRAGLERLGVIPEHVDAADVAEDLCAADVAEDLCARVFAEAEAQS